MKKKSFLSLLLVSSILFFSCKKELEPQESSAATVAETPVSPTGNPQETQPQTMAAPLPGVATPQQQTAQPAQTAPGMNPPHGQPNHRCDIAVGAPLNSPPAKTATQTPPAPAATITQATPSQTIQVGNPQNNATPAILNPAAATATAPGMNPPHGQEGHRCDIAVGAPLPKA